MENKKTENDIEKVTDVELDKSVAWDVEHVDRKAKKKWIIIIASIVAAIALLVGGFFLYKHIKAKQIPAEPVKTLEYFAYEELDAREQEFKDIVLKEAHNVDANLNLARVYAQRGDIVSCRAQIEAIMGLVPSDFRIYDLMVEVYELRNEYVEAALFVETIDPEFREQFKEKLRKEGNGLFAGYGNTMGNLTNYGWVCMTRDAIYYSEKTDGGALYRAEHDGKKKTKLSDHPTQDINVVGDTVYFVDSKEYKIYSVKTDGSDHKLLLDIFGQRLFVVGNRLYYVNWGDGCKIYSANFDGSDNKMVINVSADHVSLSGAWLFYQDREQMEAIGKVRIDGQENTLLNEVNCLFINGAGEHIYYANWGDGGKLYSAVNDMSEEPVALSDSKVGYINLYGDWIYYVDWIQDQHIFRKNLVTGALECISQDMAEGIFVKDNYVYYYNELDAERLYRIDLDGKHRKKISD